MKLKKIQMNKIKQLFCGHDYKLINQFTIPSQIDIIRENGYRPTTWDNSRRKVISDFKCNICHKNKRLKEMTV